MRSQVTGKRGDEFVETDQVVGLHDRLTTRGKSWPSGLASATTSERSVYFHSFYFICTWEGRATHITSEANIPTTRFLDRIVSDDRELLFDKGLTLRVDISFEDDFTIAFNERFGIYGFGKSMEEAVSDFNESFIDFYQDIVKISPTELGESTLRFKETLMAVASLRSNE